MIGDQKDLVLSHLLMLMVLKELKMSLTVKLLMEGRSRYCFLSLTNNECFHRLTKQLRVLAHLKVKVSDIL